MYSPLMGGGYTVVLQRAARDAEDAERALAAAERERHLYFLAGRVLAPSYRVFVFLASFFVLCLTLPSIILPPFLFVQSIWRERGCCTVRIECEMTSSL